MSFPYSKYLDMKCPHCGKSLNVKIEAESTKDLETIEFLMASIDVEIPTNGELRLARGNMIIGRKAGSQKKGAGGE